MNTGDFWRIDDVDQALEAGPNNPGDPAAVLDPAGADRLVDYFRDQTEN